MWRLASPFSHSLSAATLRRLPPRPPRRPSPPLPRRLPPPPPSPHPKFPHAFTHLASVRSFLFRSAGLAAPQRATWQPPRHPPPRPPQSQRSLRRPGRSRTGTCRCGSACRRSARRRWIASTTEAPDTPSELEAHPTGRACGEGRRRECRVIICALFTAASRVREGEAGSSRIALRVRAGLRSRRPDVCPTRVRGAPAGGRSETSTSEKRRRLCSEFHDTRYSIGAPGSL